MRFGILAAWLRHTLSRRVGVTGRPLFLLGAGRGIEIGREKTNRAMKNQSAGQRFFERGAWAGSGGRKERGVSSGNIPPDNILPRMNRKGLFPVPSEVRRCWFRAERRGPFRFL